MNFDQWVVCLDLTKMDPILIRYIDYFAEKLQPECITFLHVIETSSISNELLNQFPEYNKINDLKEYISNDLTEKITSQFNSPSFEIQTVIKEGNPTDRIIEFVNSQKFDLLIMGKKTGYKGEGTIARKIIKYVISSVLFVPETSRYTLRQALVPIDFSEQSARAVKKASEIVSRNDGRVTAQHIYTYPARFFPAIPTEEVMEKMDHHLNEKKKNFIREYGLGKDVEFVFSLHQEGEKMDEIYDQVSRDQTDIIFVANKSDKKLKSIFRDDFIDKMIHYLFGIPVFILKDKTKHKKFIESLFRST
ncbi:MAG: universal stress protein [Balneolaceae bacterium]